MHPDPSLGELSALGALSDPTRRGLYEHVQGSMRAVGRDEAADALGIPRQTAAYHLDRLAAEGLLEVEYARRSGRTGPGAGRPAKLYRASNRDHQASVPPRRYGLAARILLAAVSEGRTKPTEVSSVARKVGRELGRDGVAAALESTGYEPIEEDGEVRFRNCPFHTLKEQDQEMICRLNLGLVQGILEGATDRRRARLQPSDEYCCVRIPLGT